MKNKKIINLHKKIFKKQICNTDQLLFIASVCSFITLLVSHCHKQDIKKLINSFNIEAINVVKINELLKEYNFKKELIKPVIEELIHFYKIDEIKNLISVINDFCEIYLLHTKTKPLHYFYKKKFVQKENDESVENYILITQMIGVMNNKIKHLTIKNYADIIKFSKEIFLSVKYHD